MICSLIYGGKVTHSFQTDQIVGRKKTIYVNKGQERTGIVGQEAVDFSDMGGEGNINASLCLAI